MDSDLSRSIEPTKSQKGTCNSAKTFLQADPEAVADEEDDVEAKNMSKRMTRSF